jgi:site-specific recombinase XerD
MSVKCGMLYEAIVSHRPERLSEGQQEVAPSQVFKSVAPNLKRNGNGVYFAFAIRNGKQHKKSLETCDRPTANRKLKEFLETLDVTDPQFERMTLNQLIDRYLETIKGKSQSTITTRQGFLTRFRETWQLSLDMRVSDIKTGDLKAWFASAYVASLKPNSFNMCLWIMHGIFDLAVADGVIAHSPLRPKEKSQIIKRRRVSGTIHRLIPTPEEVEAIITEIRHNRFSDHSEDSADFVEFMAAAGLGQAESSSLTWGDVWVEKDIHTESPGDKIFVERKKTKGQWAIPIYPRLRALLIKLHDRCKQKPTYAAHLHQLPICQPMAIGALAIGLNQQRFSRANFKRPLSQHSKALRIGSSDPPLFPSILIDRDDGCAIVPHIRNSFKFTCPRWCARASAKSSCSRTTDLRSSRCSMLHSRASCVVRWSLDCCLPADGRIAVS